MGGKDEVQFWLKPEPSLRLSCVMNAFPLHLYGSAESRCLCAGNSQRKRRPGGLDAATRKQSFSEAHAQTHARERFPPDNSWLITSPGAKACVSTSWFLSLASCEDRCLSLMWLTHPMRSWFKQVRLESRDGFPGGLEGRGRRWGGSVCEGGGRVEGHRPRVQI